MTRIGLDRDALRDSFGVGVDADHGSVRSEESPAGRRPVIERGSDGYDQIGFLRHEHGGLACQSADYANAPR